MGARKLMPIMEEGLGSAPEPRLRVKQGSSDQICAAALSGLSTQHARQSAVVRWLCSAASASVLSQLHSSAMILVVRMDLSWWYPQHSMPLVPMFT